MELRQRFRLLLLWLLGVLVPAADALLMPVCALMNCYI